MIGGCGGRAAIRSLVRRPRVADRDIQRHIGGNRQRRAGEALQQQANYGNQADEPMEAKPPHGSVIHDFRPQLTRQRRRSGY